MYPSEKLLTACLPFDSSLNINNRNVVCVRLSPINLARHSLQFSLSVEEVKHFKVETLVESFSQCERKWIDNAAFGNSIRSRTDLEGFGRKTKGLREYKKENLLEGLLPYIELDVALLHV